MKRRIEELDGCRAVALLMVLAFHYLGSPLSRAYPNNFFLRVLSLGYAGVDLFFVLSGFLIGAGLLDHLDSPNYFRTFYIRRACRILPPYLLTALALEPIIRHFGFAPTRWYAYAFTANITFFTGAVWQGMSHLWSLAAEEQFYLILPLAIRIRSRVVPFACVVVVLISPFVRWLEWQRFGFAGPWYLPFGRADSLCVGVLIAYMSRLAPHLLLRCKPFLVPIIAGSSALLIAFAAMGWTNREIQSAIFGYSLFALFFGAVVISVLLTPARWSWLRDPQLVRIGRYSYTIYLVHYPVYWIAVSFSSPLAIAISVVVAFPLAALSWRFIESPCIAFGHSFHYRTAKFPSRDSVSV